MGDFHLQYSAQRKAVYMPMTSKQPDKTMPADAVVGPRQGEWTYSHYATLPDDGQRYEIVDGVLYMTPSPSGRHQEVSVCFTYHLYAHVNLKRLGKVFHAPFDLELGAYVIVQSDLMVVLNENSHVHISSRIIGMPDLVIEILSPGTAKYDRQQKYDAYARAGIKECWIADPTSCNVEIFILEADEYHSAGIFSGEQTLNSKVLSEFSVQVKQLFA